MPILDPNELDNTIFEPILQHRFIMYIDGIPSYMIKAVNGLGFEDSEVIIDHINTYFKTRGKRRYKDLTLSLYNPVAPSGAQSVSEWSNLAYEVVSGRSGYSDFFWRDLTIHILDPVGSVVSEWIIKKAFIKDVTFGEYDWAAEAYTTIQMTIGNSAQILNY